jgi:hypothetical protein
VELFKDNRTANMPRFRVSTPNYVCSTERATGFEALGVFSSLNASLTDREDPESVAGGAVTASMFEVLGLDPIADRAFRVDDERVGAARVAMLGESLWRRRFGSPLASRQHFRDITGTSPCQYGREGKRRLSVRDSSRTGTGLPCSGVEVLGTSARGDRALTTRREAVIYRSPSSE